MTHHKPRLLVHTTTMPMRWGDMDAMGHVNNTVYFRYMEQARIEWLYAHAEAGAGYATGTGPVVVNASCTFLVPAVYPGEIVVRMYLGDPGRSSVGSFYELDWNGQRCAEGAAKMVWIDVASGKSVPIPEGVIAPVRAFAAGG